MLFRNLFVTALLAAFGTSVPLPPSDHMQSLKRDVGEANEGPTEHPSPVGLPRRRSATGGGDGPAVVTARGSAEGSALSGRAVGRDHNPADGALHPKREDNPFGVFAEIAGKSDGETRDWYAGDDSTFGSSQPRKKPTKVGPRDTDGPPAAERAASQHHEVEAEKSANDENPPE